MGRPKGYESTLKDDDARRKGKRVSLRPSLVQKIESLLDDASASVGDWIDDLVAGHLGVDSAPVFERPIESAEDENPVEEVPEPEAREEEPAQVVAEEEEEEEEPIEYYLSDTDDEEPIPKPTFAEMRAAVSGRKHSHSFFDKLLGKQFGDHKPGDMKANIKDLYRRARNNYNKEHGRSRYPYSPKAMALELYILKVRDNIWFDGAEYRSCQEPSWHPGFTPLTLDLMVAIVERDRERKAKMMSRSTLPANWEPDIAFV